MDKFDWLVLYFLVLQILVIVRNFMLGDMVYFFYFCDQIPILLAIGFYFRHWDLVKALISIGFLGQLVYFIDFFCFSFFGSFLISSTGGLFYYDFFEFFVTILIHFTTLFVAFHFTRNEDMMPLGFLYSFIYLIFLYVTTLLFTPREYDLNCVYNACGISFFDFPGFTFIWLFVAICFVVMPTIFLMKLVYRVQDDEVGEGE